ncbi:MAG: phosphatidate cytidylyltransferase [Dehalococcoidia bacterium]|nr:MAG: phosphatidate cytidylyltransferase [Dehalococcoidia bacterium]
MLKKRIITALWFAPLLVIVVWFGGQPGFTALMVTFGVLAALEFYRMVYTSEAPPFTYFGLIWTAFFILSRNSELLSTLEPHFNLGLLTPLLLTSAVVLPLIGLLSRRQREGAFITWAWTIAGILYVGWLLSYLVALRGLDAGRNWVFFALFITWASDTTAFFIGRRFGRHKLASSISPGKTWEGTTGGIVGAIIMSILFFTPTPFHLPLVYWQAIGLSILVSIFGQIGDLVESLLKRNMGVKDSGKLMPGHGGILDRMDSIIFAGIVVYYYVIWAI